MPGKKRIRGRFADGIIGYDDGMNMYTATHNDPINYTDPLGLWGEKEHDDFIKKALTDAGLTDKQIQTVINQNNFFDMVTQAPADSYKHSMLDKGQSVADAMKLRSQFADEIIAIIKASRQKRKCEGDDRQWSEPELALFGQLQHPFVDETCPSHGWQEWDTLAYLTNRNGYKTRHQRGDQNPSSAQIDENKRIILGLFKEASE